MAWGEEGPVFGSVALEEGDFGEDEEYCSFSSAAGIEVEVRIGKRGGLTAHTACD